MSEELTVNRADVVDIVMIKDGRLVPADLRSTGSAVFVVEVICAEEATALAKASFGIHRQFGVRKRIVVTDGDQKWYEVTAEGLSEDPKWLSDRGKVHISRKVADWVAKTSGQMRKA